MVISLNFPQINTFQNYAPVKTNSYRSNPTSFGSQISKTTYPDLKQYSIPAVGEYYCAPVSVANGIIMLSQNGFPNLYTNDSMGLINELAKLFETTSNGTKTANMCKGLNKFVESKGYEANITYQGFRDVDSKIKLADVPDLNWIKGEISKGNAVFLNLGVYKKDSQGSKTVYTRKYGHFVSATGCGNNGLTNNPDYLTIHDPYNRVAGDHYIKVQKIKEGEFIHNKDDDEVSLTNNAKDFLEISQRFNYFAPDEVAVINGVISLQVK